MVIDRLDQTIQNNMKDANTSEIAKKKIMITKGSQTKAQ